MILSKLILNFLFKNISSYHFDIFALIFSLYVYIYIFSWPGYKEVADFNFDLLIC